MGSSWNKKSEVGKLATWTAARLELGLEPGYVQVPEPSAMAWRNLEGYARSRIVLRRHWLGEESRWEMLGNVSPRAQMGMQLFGYSRKMTLQELSGDCAEETLVEFPTDRCNL
jgi:hypothetical protein